MTNNDKFTTVAYAVVGLILFGGVLPSLISAKSTILVLTGLCIGAGYAWAGWKFVRPIVLNFFNDDNESGDK